MFPLRTSERTDSRAHVLCAGGRSARAPNGSSVLIRRVLAGPISDHCNALRRRTNRRYVALAPSGPWSREGTASAGRSGCCPVLAQHLETCWHSKAASQRDRLEDETGPDRSVLVVGMQDEFVQVHSGRTHLDSEVAACLSVPFQDLVFVLRPGIFEVRVLLRLIPTPELSLDDVAIRQVMNASGEALVRFGRRSSRQRDPIDHRSPRHVAARPCPPP